jgi:hypothetical protein
VWDSILDALGYAFLFLVALAKPTYDFAKGWIEKWLDQRFEERLASLQHEHDKQVRRVQSQIDRELDRSVRLNEKEFDVLAKAWELAYVAYWRAIAVTSRLQQKIDFSAMSSSAQRELIDENTDLSATAKAEVLNAETAEERTQRFHKHMTWVGYHNTTESRIEAVNFVEKNSLFLRRELKNLFIELDQFLDRALAEHHENLRTPPGTKREFGAAELLRTQGSRTLERIEHLAHTRIWSGEALEAPLIATEPAAGDRKAAPQG